MSTNTPDPRITSGISFEALREGGNNQTAKTKKDETVSEFLVRVRDATNTGRIIYTTLNVPKQLLKFCPETPMIFHYEGVKCGLIGYEAEVERFLSVNFYNIDDYRWYQKTVAAMNLPYDRFAKKMNDIPEELRQMRQKDQETKEYNRL